MFRCKIKLRPLARHDAVTNQQHHASSDSIAPSPPNLQHPIQVELNTSHITEFDSDFPRFPLAKCHASPSGPSAQHSSRCRNQVFSSEAAYPIPPPTILVVWLRRPSWHCIYRRTSEMHEDFLCRRPCHRGMSATRPRTASLAMCRGFEWKGQLSVSWEERLISCEVPGVRRSQGREWRCTWTRGRMLLAKNLCLPRSAAGLDSGCGKVGRHLDTNGRASIPRSAI
ncbi:hypothetical protein BO86DRAFT_119411 [Aspergillus japonicus CBS 114.51]|uniref:Uncharacterized protein n=1 Tax=Aspergillus japonicus CBS 114.51 TaxID=1448312 RepID=A0A8T8WZE0_ASPJA|nr:hypothetical protein BO86DRAFT_119411 [Aspergillus japonicus CBS 114.51]RAH81010.1 hypothetical protein BO86DRAFT_119411 [Aspergillus japonicus CBS 114.51]